MKIFVFEYITGGGLNDRPLPESLAKEGRLMLQALTEDLSQICDIDIYITIDARLNEHFFQQFSHVNLIEIPPNSDIIGVFTRLCQICEAVWPIAPESGDILYEFSRIVEATNARLLNSSAEAVKLTTSKYLTGQLLDRNKIPSVFTYRLIDFQWQENEIYVIKPDDGVGCENCFVIENQDRYEQALALIEKPGDYIIQAFIKGRSISLSCLFKNGQAWLICGNEQQISVTGQEISLEACRVNISLDRKVELEKIIACIADAIPGLWGYVGIDLIDTGNKYLVLEVNPRLTSSYAGINQALSINIAENVLKMSSGKPDLKVVKNTGAISVPVK